MSGLCTGPRETAKALDEVDSKGKGKKLTAIKRTNGKLPI